MSEPVYIAETFDQEHMRSPQTRRAWIDEQLAAAIKKGGKSMRATISHDACGLLIEVWSSLCPPSDQGAARWSTFAEESKTMPDSSAAELPAHNGAVGGSIPSPATKISDDEIFHRMICAWNGRDPKTVSPLLGPANESTKRGWLRVFEEVREIIKEMKEESR